MSKKVKTFQEKQNYTEQDIALIKSLKDKGKKPKEDIMTPEELEKQDVVLKNTGKTTEVEPGKIITPDDLKKEKEVEDLKKKEYTIKFFQQLKEWIPKDDWSDYDDFEFDHSDYLVRIFKLSDVEGFVSLEYIWSPILREFKLTNTPSTENFIPIVKILKKGKNIKETNYNVGDICVVPSTDVIGEDWNPKFLHVMQFQNSQNMKPVLPEGMRQNIPNVEKNWDRYKFVRPWVPEPEEIDNRTFLLPESKIRGSYKVI